MLECEYMTVTNETMTFMVKILAFHTLCYTANPFPVMNTGFSLCSFSHREISVMKTGFSLCGKTTQEKPCTGPVRDCSVHTLQTQTL